MPSVCRCVYVCDGRLLVIEKPGLQPSVHPCDLLQGEDALICAHGETESGKEEQGHLGG